MTDTIASNPITWLSAISLPIVVACALVVPRFRLLSEKIAPWTAAPSLFLSVMPQAVRSVDIPWLLLGSRLGLDEISRPFLFFTAFLWLTSGLFALSYLAKDSRRHLFMFFFLLAMSGNLGLIVAQDVVLFYVCFALMSFASYGLVVFSGSSEAIRAGRVYIALVIIGELLLFSGLVVAVATTGSVEWNGLGDRLAGTTTVSIAMLLLFFGLAVKAGALPLHVWLPLAHPAAPVPASAVLSGAMIKAGLIGWLRLVPLDSGVMALIWGEICLTLGLAAAFYGVAVGLTQTNAKTVLAYSSISQMGLMTIGLGLALSAPTMSHEALLATAMYAMHHAFAKGALFLGVGVATAACGSFWRRWFCGLGLLMPALALAGMPLTSGALAKLALKATTDAAPGKWPESLNLLLPVAAIGTTLLMARFLWIAWPRRDMKPHGPMLGIWLSWLTLLVTVAFGVFLWSWGSETMIAKSLLSPSKMLVAFWPIVAGVFIATTFAIVSIAGYQLHVPIVPAGDVLEIAMRLATPLVHRCMRTVSSCKQHAGRAYALFDKLTEAMASSLRLAGYLEQGLRRSLVFGIVLLTITGVILGLLAFS
jgi:formate hydrogenlyase subunit 3/multisubunit Na+/H+ antiporter MnhD subunit